MELYLVRHAESLGNIGVTHSSHPDPKLSPSGIEQAQCLAEYFERSNIRFDKIYTSHLSRALHTTAIIASRQEGMPQITVDPNFCERGTPVDYEADEEYHKTLYPNLRYIKTALENDRHGDIERIEIPLWEHVYSPAYNETTETELKNGNEIRSNPQKILVVAHASINACILSRLVNFRFVVNMNIFQHNTCVNRFKLFLHNGAQRTAFLSYNDYSHLPEHLRNPY